MDGPLASSSQYQFHMHRHYASWLDGKEGDNVAREIDTGQALRFLEAFVDCIE